MDIFEIANKIKENGGELYLVGGAVRDELLGKKAHDEDYCVTGIELLAFTKLFPQARVRGKSFSVFDIEHKEFALARTERKKEEGHRGFEIHSDKFISIEEDLARRDITINSMAKNVLTGEIIDPFGGQADLKAHVIRATTEKFSEDPLRVYRVARFAAQMEFNVEKNTLELMKSLEPELQTLSKERVFDEFRKALESNKPSYFFQTLRKADLLKPHFIEIENLIGKTQPEIYHPEGDSYNHTMLAVDYSCKKTNRLEVRYSVLLHDLGKGETPKEMLPHHYGHDKAGIQLVQKLSKRLGVPTLWEKCAVLSCKEHMRAGIFERMKPKKQVELLELLSKSGLGLDGMSVVVEADKCSSGEKEKVVNFEYIGNKMLKEVNGNTVSLSGKTGIERKEEIKKARINWLKNLQT